MVVGSGRARLFSFHHYNIVAVSYSSGTGGVAGDWTDNGPCTTAQVATAKVDATAVHPSAAATTLAPATKSSIAISAKASEVPKASMAISTQASAVPKVSIALANVEPKASSSVESAEGTSRRQNSRFFKLY